MRLTLASAAACVALLGLVGCAKIESRDLIREGNRLYNDGKFLESIDKYDAAEDLEPDGVTLFWNRACAAESQVLKMKKPEQREERRKYADMALKDFQTWYDRLEKKTAEDTQQLADHRLAILDADERCDDLLTHWLEKHRAAPSQEQLYGTIARQYDKCGQPDKVEEWYVKRTKDFPQSVKAWHALAIRRWDPLWPDPESGLPFNENVPAGERIKIADEVIDLLNNATGIDAKFRDAYVWRSMAYTQRQHARIVVEAPESPEERIEAIRAREDAMMAWRQQKAVCDLEELTDCPGPTVDTPCCPPPPLSTDDQTADAEARIQIEAEMKAAAAEAEAEAEDSKNKRKRRRKR